MCFSAGAMTQRFALDRSADDTLGFLPNLKEGGRCWELFLVRRDGSATGVHCQTSSNLPRGQEQALGFPVVMLNFIP